MQNKVIFLDFDGPLHPSSAIEGIRFPPDELACTERNLFRWAIHLDMILKELRDGRGENILIAVHSSWRQIQGLSQSLIRQMLGPRLANQYIGMTRPDLSRWDSIQEMCERAEITDFIVIDDSYKEFPKDLPQLVICNPLKGLSDKAIQKRIRDWAMSDTPQHAHQEVGQI